MGGFDISPASLRQSANGMVDVVDRMAQALNTLETKLHGYGSPWGAGVIGSLIGELYQAIHDVAFDSYEGNAEIISEYAQGLDGMADTLQEWEAQVESGFADIGSQLGQGFPGLKP